MSTPTPGIWCHWLLFYYFYFYFLLDKWTYTNTLIYYIQFKHTSQCQTHTLDRMALELALIRVKFNLASLERLC